jgi:hypothetical protein
VDSRIEIKYKSSFAKKSLERNDINFVLNVAFNNVMIHEVLIGLDSKSTVGNNEMIHIMTSN